MIEFKSFLARDLEKYLEFRANIGYRYKRARWFLSPLDHYISQNQVAQKDLTPAFFLDFRQSLDMDPGTVNKVFNLLKGFFDYLIRMEKVSKNPVANIPALSENHYIPFIFSPVQVDALLSAVQNQIRKNRQCFFLRDLAVYTSLCLMARCGLRISEPLRIMDYHYRRDEMTLYIEKTKFHKDRLIPVPKHTLPVIDNFLSVRDSLIGHRTSEYLLTVRPDAVVSKSALYKFFHRAVKQLGICRPRKIIGNVMFGHPRPHSLRHSFAVNTLKSVRQRGRSAQNALPVLAAYMGHTKWHYTMKYLKVIDAEQGEALVDFCVMHKGQDFI